MNDELECMPRLQSREEYVDHLEGFAVPTVDEPQTEKSTRKIIKTFMLETAGRNHLTRDLTTIFPHRVHLHRLDDTMYRVEDSTQKGGVVGLLEELDERHPVLYTTLPAEYSKRWVRDVVDPNPWLDRLWLSSPILFELWQYVSRNTPSHRYVRLGFEHEARYEVTGYLDDSSSSEDNYQYNMSHEDEESWQGFSERRQSKVNLTERLSILNKKLPELMKLYDPLHSLVRLQMPSSERGGHLFYDDGRATNRSDSFVEHRATVSLVLGLYRRITERAEQLLWGDMARVEGDAVTSFGAPVTILFSQPLTESTFNRFIDIGLRRQGNRFRVGGYLTRHGPTKIHMAAIDRHLWQPFLLEATSKQLLGILPFGTCGNTVHRLVTNVQRYLDPSVDVWLGGERYKTAVANSMAVNA